MRTWLSIFQFAKIDGDVWFKIKVPDGNGAEYGRVDKRAPHDRLMNQVQRAKDGRVRNNQDEDCDYQMARPRFSRSESVSDERHENSDDDNERRGDAQPFLASNTLTAHDVWPDIESRQQDRQVHANGCQSRKPGQDTDRKRLLYFCHWKVTRHPSRASPILCGSAVSSWAEISDAFPSSTWE